MNIAEIVQEVVNELKTMNGHLKRIADIQELSKPMLEANLKMLPHAEKMMEGASGLIDGMTKEIKDLNSGEDWKNED